MCNVKEAPPRCHQLYKVIMYLHRVHLLWCFSQVVINYIFQVSDRSPVAGLDSTRRSVGGDMAARKGKQIMTQAWETWFNAAVTSQTNSRIVRCGPTAVSTPTVDQLHNLFYCESELDTHKWQHCGWWGFHGCVRWRWAERCKCTESQESDREFE